MLGLGRKTPTRAEQISSELGEAGSHLKEVAALIAGGAAERLNPRVEQAREMVSPRMDKARGAALHGLENVTVALGGRKRRPAWPMLAGALGIGVLAGLAVALVMQRRNARWDEYEPVHVLDFEEPPSERFREKAREVKDQAREVADQVKETAGEVKDTVRGAASDVADSVATGVKKLK
ncbi:YtxH domain-containing protein [Longispora albida]|uniref:YtxH domain-containing protein n=1 Tax=Longispora albida TaxID=203523 RepID=UPI0003761944|nr:YtxH domain-containing protein [Longispora albida]